MRREELVAQVPLLYAGARPAGRAAPGGRRQLSAAADAGLDQPRLALDEQLGPLTFLPDWSAQRRVGVELELLGLNVSAHPLRFVRDEVEALGVTPMGRLPEVRHGRRVRVAGVLERAQMPWIRSGHRTMFLTLEDETELGQVVVFNDVYLKYGRVLKDAIYLLVDGELQNDEEHGLAVVAHRITDLLRAIGRDEEGGRRASGAAAARPPRVRAPAGPPSPAASPTSGRTPGSSRPWSRARGRAGRADAGGPPRRARPALRARLVTASAPSATASVSTVVHTAAPAPSQNTRRPRARAPRATPMAAASGAPSSSGASSPQPITP